MTRPIKVICERADGPPVQSFSDPEVAIERARELARNGQEPYVFDEDVERVIWDWTRDA